MKNTQVETEDVFDDVLVSILPEQITKLENDLAKLL